jgi:hypothetical protein
LPSFDGKPFIIKQSYGCNIIHSLCKYENFLLEADKKSVAIKVNY